MALWTTVSQLRARVAGKIQRLWWKVLTAIGVTRWFLTFAYRQLTRPDEIVLEGIKLAVRDDFWRSREPLYSEKYERSELAILKDKLVADDRVMELGTGLGLLSSFCAKRIGSSRVFTYEANPALEDYIRQNYKLNDVNPHLELCLLAKEPGERSFYRGKNFYSSSTVRRYDSDTEIRVPVKSFNAEIRRIDPTFLIVDIEGGEVELFEFADLYNVKKLLIELHDRVVGKEKIEAVKAILTKAGFEILIASGDELFLQRS